MNSDIQIDKVLMNRASLVNCFVKTVALRLLLLLHLLGYEGLVHGQCGGDTWSYFIKAMSTDVVHRIVHHPNGDMYIGGTSNSFSSTQDLFLARFTQDTVLVWAKIYHCVGNDGGLSLDLVAGPSGSLYFSHIVSMGTSSDAGLIKMNEEGEVLWARRVLAISGYAEGRAVIESPNGDVFMAGSTNSIGAGLVDGFMARFSPDGTLFWLKAYGGSGFDHFTHINELADGTYVLGSQTSSFFGSNRKAFVARINPDGNVLSAVQHGGVVYDDYNHAYRNEDGSYLRVGFSDSYGPGGRDVLVVLTDSIGTIYWSKAYGTPNGSELGLNAVSDGSGGWYIAAYSSPSREFHVLHISTDGGLIDTKKVSGFYVHQSSSWTQAIYHAPNGRYLLAGATPNGQYPSQWDIGVLQLDTCAMQACEMIDAPWTETSFTMMEQSIPFPISATSSSVNSMSVSVNDVTASVMQFQEVVVCTSCPIQLFHPDVSGCIGTALVFQMPGDQSSFADWDWVWDLGDGVIVDPAGQVEHTYTSQGVYEVHVLATLNDACQDSITFMVTVSDLPEVDLGPDIYQCDEPSNVSLTTGQMGQEHLWSDGSVGPSIMVTTSGTYWVQVGPPGCSTTDTITVHMFTVPAIDLGSDVLICPGDTLILTSGYPAALTTWQDGTASSTYTVTEPGTYTAIVEVDGCMGMDEVEVEFIALPELDMTSDTILCDLIPIMLEASSSTNEPMIWQDGSVGEEYLASGPGVYEVMVINECGVFSDSIRVDLAPDLDGPDDQMICQGQELLVTMGPVSSIEWQNGSTESSVQLGVGIHAYELIDIYGCIRQGSFEIILDPLSADEGHVPNVFSPNGDGLNDRFIIAGADEKDFSLQIYDRWGRILFDAHSPHIGWDGTQAGHEASEGTYFYILEYRSRCGDGDLRTRSGHLTLLR